MLRLVAAEVRRVETEQTEFVTDYSDVLVAIASIDASWRATIIDLIRVDPTMWSSIRFAFGARLGQLVVDQLAIDDVARAWLQHATAAEDEQPSLWWSWGIVYSVEDWADEETHRRLLERLVDLADRDTIWDVAAGPLEDFVANRNGRLDWLEQQAAINAKFVEALSGVWTQAKTRLPTPEYGRSRRPDSPLPAPNDGAYSQAITFEHPRCEANLVRTQAPGSSCRRRDRQGTKDDTGRVRRGAPLVSRTSRMVAPAVQLS